MSEVSQLIQSGDQDNYRIVDYLEPMTEDDDVFPLEATVFAMQHNDVIQRAIDTGQPASTGLFRIGQEHNIQHGFAVVMPVYRTHGKLLSTELRRQAVVGYTIAFIRASKLAQKVLQPSGFPNVFNIDINLYASATPDEGNLAFRAGSPPPASSHSSTFAERLLHNHQNRISETFNVADKQWHMVVSAPPMLFTSDNLGSLCVLLGGILSSLLAATYLQKLAFRSQRIQRLVDERTAELKLSNQLLTQDIAARVKAERTLTHTQNILTNAQKVAGMGSWEFDAVKNEIRCSDEFFRICGLEPQSIEITVPFVLSIVHPEDRARAENAIVETREKSQAYSIEKRIVRPDGSIRYVISRGEIILDDKLELRRVIGSFLDITERKQVELDLQLSQELYRRLASHQENIKEDERKRIAREIHDDLGQNLLALRIDVSMLHTRTVRHPELNEKVSFTLEQLDTIIKSVKSIINNLRPSILDLGLHAAIVWQLNDFQKRTGIAYELVADQEEYSIDGKCATALFRILQESLTNVFRHAHASLVTISLSESDGMLCMEITDNGKGFLSAYPRKENSFGLLGMEERIIALDGSFAISSTPGKGTIITVSVPSQIEVTDLC